MRMSEEELQEKLTRLRRSKLKWQFIRSVLINLLIIWVIFYFFIGLAVVEGNSMRPNLLPGDILLYSKLAKDGWNYGDIVIISYSDTIGENMNIVKRIVGVPGDLIEVDEMGHLMRNGELVTEQEAMFGYQETDDWIGFPVIVPEDSYFYLGDNRAVSLDSRRKMQGFAQKDQILGTMIAMARVSFLGN